MLFPGASFIGLSGTDIFLEELGEHSRGTISLEISNRVDFNSIITILHDLRFDSLALYFLVLLFNLISVSSLSNHFSIRVFHPVH